MQISGRWVAATGANRQDLAAQPLRGTVTRAGPNGPSGWDAGAYDRLSDPQYAWGQRVIGRLELRGDETVLDAGCGTGRLTALLLERLPHGRVIAVDRSPAMLAAARSNLAAAGRRVAYLCADLQAIVLGRPVDAIFSTATFHWILDHPRLFRALAGVLIPGGRLEAQCGGGPNLARLRARVEGLVKQEPFATFFQGWREPWRFSWPAEAAEQLERAGFGEVATSLEAAPTSFDSAGAFGRFLRQVVLWPQLERLPERLREPFMGSLVAQAAGDDPPFVVDYWRLNLRGRRRMAGPWRRAAEEVK